MLQAHILVTQMSTAYDAAAQWLQTYGRSHADLNPLDQKWYLPASELNPERHYYELYRRDANQDAAAYAAASTGPPPLADMETFERAWRVECPWLVLKHLQVFKRPAARSRISKRPLPAMYNEEEEPALPSSTPAWMHPVPTAHPKWATHTVTTLQEARHLPGKDSKGKLTLSVWSDCSGINSEMFALRELEEALHTSMPNVIVEFSLWMSCELDSTSRDFTTLNHGPLHMSEKMEQRNFQSGQMYCCMHDHNIDIPRNGVDVYVGTYPCSPWSRRGNRTGFDHPDAQATIIGFKTIAFVSPVVFVIEIGEVPSQASLDEILQKLQEILDIGIANYNIQVVRGMTPAWSGYPTRRKRLFIVGWRCDIQGIDVCMPLRTLMESPLAVEQSFLRFLGLRREFDWSRVGECPTQAELAILSQSTCTCGLDPMVICPVHPCKCHRCGKTGLECTWRRMFIDYMNSDSASTVLSKKQGTLTYLQALEMQGGQGPTQPRQRVLINLIAVRPEANPLNETLMIGDVSQNPPFGDMFAEGDTPVFTTTSNVWVFQVGHTLHTKHMAALMGLDLSRVKISRTMSETWFRHRLGLAVHIANFGIVLMAALAPPLRMLLAREGMPST